jgi:glycosyltransferase involved in cell wall biosynthesis
VICDSDAIRWELQRRGVVEPERLVVVPLGVEADFARDGPNSLPAAVEVLLTSAGPGPGSRRMILHVGAMVARKRLDLVLRSFAKILQAEPAATLVRAGGALSPPMRSLARELGVDRSVVEMPFLSRAELAALYRRAHVFLLCSETEGFGLPVLEAMASGLPVIARDLPAIREVAGDAVRLVSGDDPEAFATSVLDVLRDQGVRDSLRQRGLERAAGFGWADTAARTQRVYDELLVSLARRPDRA